MIYSTDGGQEKERSFKSVKFKERVHFGDRFRLAI
jgi:hypothetical protein